MLHEYLKYQLSIIKDTPMLARQARKFIRISNISITTCCHRVLNCSVVHGMADYSNELNCILNKILVVSGQATVEAKISLLVGRLSP